MSGIDNTTQVRGVDHLYTSRGRAARLRFLIDEDDPFSSRVLVVFCAALSAGFALVALVHRLPTSRWTMPGMVSNAVAEPQRHS